MIFLSLVFSFFALTGHFAWYIIVLVLFFAFLFACLFRVKREIRGIALSVKKFVRDKRFEKFVLDESDVFSRLKEQINNLIEITEPLIKTKESALEQIKKITDVMDFPVFLLSSSGRILLYNNASEIFVRKGCDNCFYYEVFKSVSLSDIVGKCLNKDIKGEEFRIFGRIYSVNSFGNISLTGERSVLCMFEDVTAEKTKEKLEREFISAVSHELKTPLSVIEGAADILADKSLSSGERHKFVSLIGENARRMNSLVRNLLILTEIRSDKKFKKERINLREITEYVLKEESPSIKEKKLCVETHFEDVEIIGNKFLLTEMVRNIFDNAVKYTEIGKITFTLSFENSFAKIVVKDTGPGMSEEILSHIFEPFYREDVSRTRSTGGTGLGLTIAKRVANLHGGNVTVKSVIDKGTEFVIQIPGF